MSSAHPKIGFVSLGCPKALVDSERILTQLRAEGYDFVPTYRDADVVVVNTCGFIDPATAESLDAIGEAMAENGRVIVTGCLGKRPEQILHAFPNVLAISGPQDYASVMQAVHRAAPRRADPFVDLIPIAAETDTDAVGVKLTPRHYAYLKISEGCNHRCSFCIIPALRGDLISRPVDDVLREAERLVHAGVQELLVISQDTSAYGVDIGYTEKSWHGRRYATRMKALCEGLAQLGVWIRLHYVYPYPHVDDIIPLMADGRILPYLDVPFQHANPRILRQMKRPGDVERTLQRIQRWRERCPDLTIRSTFIVGFPGETEAEFEELLAFLEEAQLDRVGAFAYSPVDGAAANAFPNPVPEPLKQERLARFMALQAEISAEKLAAKVGTCQRCLVDHMDGELAIARSMADAPDIDGTVQIQDGAEAALRPGEFVTVRIMGSDDHDLYGEVEY